MLPSILVSSDVSQQDSNVETGFAPILLAPLKLDHCVPFIQRAHLDLFKLLLMRDPLDFKRIGIKEDTDCKRLASLIQNLQAHLANKGLLRSAAPVPRPEYSDQFTLSSFQYLEGGVREEREVIKRALYAFDSQILPSVYITYNSPPMPCLTTSDSCSDTLSALKEVLPSIAFSNDKGKTSIRSSMTFGSSDISMYEGSDMEEDDDEEKEEALPLSELPPYPPITASVSHSLLPTSAHPLYDKTHPAAYSRQRKPVPRVTRPLSLPPPSASHISTSSSIVPPPLPSSASTLHAIKSDRRSTSTPPDYQDTALQKLWERNRSFVLPREEEGMEVLPDYHCTVSKMGHVNVKREMDAPGVRSRKRGWRKLYLEIWGTLLRVYRASPNGSSSLSPSLWNYKAVSFKQWNKYYYTPIATYSLAGAEATRALDYTKRANSLRFITAHGPQFLLQLPTVSEMSSWVEHLQSAINISLDLEYRPMPKFITVSARAHNVSFLTGRHLTAERARQQYLREQAETLV